jgi:hypothetical protein
MSEPEDDDEPGRNSFEDSLRALADEIARGVESVSRGDLDELARSAGVDPERARQWIDEAGRRIQSLIGDAIAPAPPGSVRPDGPHPLDLPTDDQGRALAALDSGRWKLHADTVELEPDGDGPTPQDALGVALELRVRDWIGADGALTVAGRRALERWLESR